MFRSHFLFASAMLICENAVSQAPWRYLEPAPTNVVELPSSKGVESNNSLAADFTPKRHYRPRYRTPKYSENYSIVGITTGVWTPLGWNKLLGVHPFIGCMLGGWHNRTLYEFNMEFRFVNAANSYTVIYDGAPRTQNHYFGGFIGFHMGYAFATYKSTSLYGLAGLGFDGFDVVDGDDTHDGMSINALNKNVGVGIQHFGKTGGFIGLEATYNIICYSNPGGTPLNGNAVSIRLIFGGINGL